jgi:hypothetical protein
VLLVVTAISSKKIHAVLWKSSVLPLLFAQLETRADHDLGLVGTIDEMVEMSRNIQVEMARKEPPLLAEQ